ncbi:gamma-mobile-trio integrase GmtZ [Massilia niastensis]|uniref:gamma-mobile-trio integrase GmtZ n=1 Tax=Massilia niastensis TaxID=544911 RepID=UPI00146CDD95|nr:VPA1269 family protein [Massilia niastensis]
MTKTKLALTAYSADLHEFGRAFDSLLAPIYALAEETSETRTKPISKHDKAAIFYFVCCCRIEGLLLFPQTHLFPLLRIGAGDKEDKWGDELLPTTYLDEIGIVAPIALNARWLANIRLKCFGIESVLDFLPEVINPFFLHAKQAANKSVLQNLAKIPKPLVAYQTAHYKKALRHTAAHYESLRARDATRGKAGTDFAWVLTKDPSLNEWRELAARYYRTLTSNLPGIQNVLNTFLDHLASHPYLPRDPRVFLNKRAIPTQLYEGRGGNLNGHVDFIEWVIKWGLAEVDAADGSPLRSRFLKNPFERKINERRRADTPRDPMPPFLVEKAIEVLTGNEWEWAKKVSGNGFSGEQISGDWFRHYDPQARSFKRIWSPVRAVALYLKLRTVLRLFQVIHLDSGEADYFRLTAGSASEDAPSRYSMIRNKHQLASKLERTHQAKGVLQTISDNRTGQVEVFLRVSTNKSQDRNKDASEKGYDSPWAADDVIKVLMWLREWQEKNNPILRITPWEEVPDLLHAKGKIVLKGMENCFLFRDPTSPANDHPISESAVLQLWLALCDEVEKRLAAETITDPIGTNHYKLVVQRDDAARATKVRYDLHSLRVTNITALDKAGVPAHIVMLIAGHANLSMKLYYTKYSMSETRELLTTLNLAGDINAWQKEWINSTKDLDFRRMTSLFAYNDMEAVHRFERSDHELVFMDVGMCTASCAGCHEGKTIRTNGRKTSYGPVPGGRRNCAECRYLLSGPPFLTGLVATINVKSLAGVDVARRRTNAQREINRLKGKRHEAIDNPSLFGSISTDELVRWTEDLERLTAEFDQIMLEMSAAASLAIECTEIHNKVAAGEITVNGKLVLLTRDKGTLEQQFEQCSEFELLDRVCENSVFFESIQGETVDKASLKRNRYYDQVLIRHGLEPAFLTLDEQTALKVGNELSRLMYLRLGKTKAINVLDGRDTLENLGILTDTLTSFGLEAKRLDLNTPTQ